MNIEIKKSDAGYHVKDIEKGTDVCLETLNSLMKCLSDFMPTDTGDECRMTS